MQALPEPDTVFMGSFFYLEKLFVVLVVYIFYLLF